MPLGYEPLTAPLSQRAQQLLLGSLGKQSQTGLWPSVKKAEKGRVQITGMGQGSRLPTQGCADLALACTGHWHLVTWWSSWLQLRRALAHWTRGAEGLTPNAAAAPWSFSRRHS